MKKQVAAERQESFCEMAVQPFQYCMLSPGDKVGGIHTVHMHSSPELMWNIHMCIVANIWQGYCSFPHNKQSKQETSFCYHIQPSQGFLVGLFLVFFCPLCPLISTYELLFMLLWFTRKERQHKASQFSAFVILVLSNYCLADESVAQPSEALDKGT